MVNTENIHQLSLEQLNCRWRVAATRLKYWQKQPGREARAKVFSYMVDIAKLTREFEERADLLPTGVMWFLINSSLKFTIQ